MDGLGWGGGREERGEEGRGIVGIVVEIDRMGMRWDVIR